MVSGKVKSILQVLGVGVFVIVLMLLFPQSIGLGAGGFDSDIILQQYLFYAGPGIGFLVGILLIIMYAMTIKEGDAKYGNSVGFASPGESPALPFFKRFSNFQLGLLSFILFAISGIFSFVLRPQTTFTGLTILEQQFTEVASVLFSSGLIPAAENLGAAFLIAVSFLVIRHIHRKYKASESSFKIIMLTIVPILVGVYGFINHLLRYSGSDTSLITVFIFWTIGGLITVVTGSFIPFLMMHVVNNAIFDIQRFFSSETMLTVIVTIVIFLSVVYYIMYRKKGLLGRTRSE